RLHHHRGLGNAQAGAAELLRHRDAEPAVARHRLVKVGREAAVAIALEPVVVRKARAQPRDRLADPLLLLRKGEVHRYFLCCTSPAIPSAIRMSGHQVPMMSFSSENLR